MQKYFLSICSFIVLVTACNSNDNKEPTSLTSTDNSVATTENSSRNLSGCYEMVMKRDTAHLQLAVNDSTVKGDLTYNWYMRDGNTGSIDGKLRDSMIHANYYFISEGLHSVREVIFKVRGDNLIQAFGELTEEDEKIVFQNKDSLQFLYNYPFMKIECDSLHR